MSPIVSRSIVVLVHRWGIYLTVRAHNWSDQFNYIDCDENMKNIQFIDYETFP